MILFVFSSNSCAPCKSLKDNLKKNGISFIEMNFDKMDDNDRRWSTQFKIMSLPTLIFMDNKKQKVENQMIGNVPVETIKKYLRRTG